MRKNINYNKREETMDDKGENTEEDKQGKEEKKKR